MITTTTKENSQVLYENTNYGFRIITTNKCEKGYWVIKETKQKDDSISIFVLAPKNKSLQIYTPPGSFKDYLIASRDYYDEMTPDPISEKKLDIIEVLKNDFLLLGTINPTIQDSYVDPKIPVECVYQIEKI